MEKIFSLAGELASALHESDNYKNYLSAKAKLSDNPELLSKISEFKRSHMDYQTKLISGIDPGLDDEKRVSGLYWELMLDEDARRYFAGEKAMLEQISALQKIILDGCKMDLDF